MRNYIFALALLIPTVAGAQNLSILVDSAMKHLPLLLEKQALVSSAKAGVTMARNSFLPSLNALDEANLASSNSVPGPYESFGIIPSISSSVEAANNYQAATGNIGILYGEYELLNFGLRKARVQNAQAVVGVRQADLEFQSYLLKAQVSRLYFQLLKTAYQLGVDRQNILRYVTVDTIIGALTVSGIRPGVDSSLAKAELSKARVAYNERMGTLAQLTQELSYLTGIPADRIPLDTASTANQTPDPALVDGKGDPLSNPLVGYYLREKEFYQSNENLVKKSYLPKIFLTGGAWGRGSSINYQDEYKSLGTGLDYQRYNYMFGLTLTYNLFDPIHRRDALNQSRYETQSSNYAIQQQELSLNSAAAQALEAIRAADNNLREIPVQIQAATDAYNQKVAQYKAGLINLVDLTDASYVLYSAQISYTETLNNWFTASLDRATATGNLDQFIQRIK
jgi:outer membrane protein TolC